MSKYQIIIESTPNGNIRVRHREPGGKRVSDYCIGKHESAVVDGKTLTGKSLAKALAERVKVKYLANELGEVDKEADLQNLVERHLANDRANGLLPLTVLSKQFILASFLKQNDLTKLGELLTPGLIAVWKEKLAAKGLASSTIRNSLVVVHTWYGWLRRSGFMKTDYFGEKMIPEQLESQPRFYTPEEFQALDRVAAAMAAICRNGISINKAFEARKAINLAHDAGLRKIEMVGFGSRKGAQFEDIEYFPDGTATLHLPKTVVKGQKKGRSVPLSRRLLEILGSARTGPLVALSREQLDTQFRKARRLAKLTRKLGFGGITLHGGRHTFAKNCLQMGGAPTSAVQDLLGHSDPSSTKIYSQFEKSFMRDIIDRVDRAREDKSAG